MSLVKRTQPAEIVPSHSQRATKAAILVRQREPLVVDKVIIPKLKAGQVLVQVQTSGICGKQLDEIMGRRGPDPYAPHLLGHEGFGTVREIGPGVRKVKRGDQGILHWMKGRGIDAEPPKFRWNGQWVNAGCVTTFSEFTVASENRITPVEGEIKPEVACLLGCAVTTGLGIVFNDIGLQPGQSIAVFGIGGVGVNVLQGAALVNAYPIVAVDRYPSKLEMAKTFGATHTILAGSHTKLHLLEIIGTRKYSATVDTTGNTAVRQLAYDVTSDQGKTILAGVPHHEEMLEIDSFPLHFGRRILGSHGGDTQPDTDIPRYIQLYRLGKLKLDEQITHRWSLSEINEALSFLQKGEAGRCVIHMGL